MTISHTLIGWRVGMTMSNIQLEICRRGRKCATGLGGRCHTKNVVYEIVCELCEEKKTRNTYIGETKRSARLRFNEHLRDATTTPNNSETRRDTELLILLSATT